MHYNRSPELLVPFKKAQMMNEAEQEVFQRGVSTSRTNEEESGPMVHVVCQSTTVTEPTLVYSTLVQDQGEEP